jgi:hypothetical protein
LRKKLLHTQSNNTDFSTLRKNKKEINIISEFIETPNYQERGESTSSLTRQQPASQKY